MKQMGLAASQYSNDNQDFLPMRFSTSQGYPDNRCSFDYFLYPYFGMKPDFSGYSGEGYQYLALVLKEINNATLSNDQKANAIANIQNGVGFLVKLVSKVV